MIRILKTGNGQRSAVGVHLSLIVAVVLFAGLSQAQDDEEASPTDAEEVGEQAEAEADSDGEANSDAEADSVAEEVENPAAGLTRPATVVADLSPIIRDPFWPVGFDPNPPVPTAAPTPAPKPRPEIPLPPPVRLPEPGDTEWSAARRQLAPTVGRSVDPDGIERFFTILNNRLVNAGQTVSVTTPVFLFTWRVVRITEAGVEFLAVEARRLSDGKRFPAAAAETN